METYFTLKEKFVIYFSFPLGRGEGYAECAIKL
jgi:hypothetical protein